jgi:hypothetical protein
MLEPSAKRCLGWTLLLAATFSTPGWAGETLPPSVRACSTLTDRDTRLACFDREVASFPDDSKAPSQAAKTQSNGTAPAPAQHAATATPPAPAPATSAAPAAAASTSTPAPADKAGKIFARVVSIDRSPDDMVLHLDNGQAWEQTQSVTGDLSLKVGDSVTIDKHFGSYWLNGPHVSGMKVRQKT